MTWGLLNLQDVPSGVENYRAAGPWWVHLGDHEIPVAGTYFAGTKRHQGFAEVVKDVRSLLSMNPRVRIA